jgi:hypothetical protein
MGHNGGKLEEKRGDLCHGSEYETQYWPVDIGLCCQVGETAQGRRPSNGLWAVTAVSRGSTGFRMGAKGRTPLSNEAGPKRADADK